MPRRVDNYWREVFKLKNTMAEKKYTLLEKVVKVVKKNSRMSGYSFKFDNIHNFC